MFVELHMLQNFAPSCLNRDDTNSPKECIFGGCRRARISSQCIKRAIRTHPIFEETVGVQTGVRTNRLIEALTKELTERGKDAEVAQKAAVVLATSVVGKVGDNNKTKALVYLGRDEIERMVDFIEQNWETVINTEEKLPKQLIKTLELHQAPRAADIALFGRMIAENTDMNVNAACQVAHAISTHRVEMEMDFYTAADDLNPAEEAGAGMMGIVEFNSSCFYRYALVDFNQLVENLHGDKELAMNTVEGFLRASVAAIPTGKQNSMAAQNPPSLVFAVVRNGMPWSLANAFEEPIQIRRNTKLVSESIEALDEYWGRLVRVYGNGSVIAKALCCLNEVNLSELNDAKKETVEDVIAVVRGTIGAGEI